jgi:hypothetical protein
VQVEESPGKIISAMLLEYTPLLQEAQRFQTPLPGTCRCHLIGGH